MQRRENKCRMAEYKWQILQTLLFCSGLPRSQPGYYGEDKVESKGYPEYETHQIKTMPHSQIPGAIL